jgi:signal transduction histidine kinase/ActR/RegA family two-component response regulator
VSLTDFSDLGLFLFGTSMVGNALLGVVLLALHRVYRQPFLLHWALSWLALALFHLGMLVLSGTGLRPEPVRLALLGLTLLAGFGQVALLVSGTALLVRGRPLGRAARLGLASLPFLFALVAMLASAGHGKPSLARDALHQLAFGIAFLGAAAGVARVSRRTSSSVSRLVVVVLVAVGLLRLWSLGWRLEHSGAFVDLSELIVPQLLDLLLQQILALGVVTWFFEEERANRARTARELQASEELRARSEHMEAVGRLAGGVAHDFNNLLTAITGHAELLLARSPPGHPDREDVVPIARAADRAAELVRELLAFSRRQPLRPRYFVLDELLTELRRMIARLIGESVHLELFLGAPDVVLHADPVQLELAVINLATNARDALEGSGELCLTTSRVHVPRGADPVLTPGDYALLEVEDTGCGIPVEAQAKIFEPYFTTKAGKGNGLGLPSVYGFVKQSGGDVRVESEPGRGTTFRIWLPAAANASEPLTSPTVELVPSAPSPPDAGGDESILLVEDDLQVRLLAQRLLTRAGYRVTPAGSVDEARGCLCASPGAFGLVLCDVVLPGRPVRELLDELAHAPSPPPVLLMSGYSEAAIGKHGIALERMPFLAKPFTRAALLAAVRAELDRTVRATSGAT